MPAPVAEPEPALFAAPADQPKPNSVGAAAAPETAGTIYFELDEGLGIDTWTEGNIAAFSRYNMLCKRV